MISLSLLPTAHPRLLQGPPVRSSLGCYPKFNLAMGRSHGFRVECARLNAQLGLAFAPASPQRGLTSPRTFTRRVIMQKARGHSHRQTLRKDDRLLPLIVSTWFQVLFHSPPGVLFTFPSRYWCTIGQLRVFSLRRWSSWIPTGFLVPRGTWEPSRGRTNHFCLRDLHPLWCFFPEDFG